MCWKTRKVRFEEHLICFQKMVFGSGNSSPCFFRSYRARKERGRDKEKKKAKEMKEKSWRWSKKKQKAKISRRQLISKMNWAEAFARAKLDCVLSMSFFCPAQADSNELIPKCTCGRSHQGHAGSKPDQKNIEDSAEEHVKESQPHSKLGEEKEAESFILAMLTLMRELLRRRRDRISSTWGGSDRRWWWRRRRWLTMFVSKLLRKARKSKLRFWESCRKQHHFRSSDVSVSRPWCLMLSRTIFHYSCCVLPERHRSPIEHTQKQLVTRIKIKQTRTPQSPSKRFLTSFCSRSDLFPLTRLWRSELHHLLSPFHPLPRSRLYRASGWQSKKTKVSWSSATILQLRLWCKRQSEAIEVCFAYSRVPVEELTNHDIGDWKHYGIIVPESDVRLFVVNSFIKSM